MRLKHNAFGLVFFILIFTLLTGGLISMNASTKAHTKTSLEQALQRGVMEYYILNGYYPSSLKELKTVYPLTYDKKEYKITMHYQNKSTLPHFTVVEK